MGKMRSFRPKKINSVLKPQVTGANSGTENGFLKKATNFVTELRGSGGNHDVIKIISLGGVGNVQRNMFVYEYRNDIVLIDCGVGFPEEDMPGVDLVLPDISYLRDKKEKIRGIILSHGHDDHIGGLPYLWPELNVPIYTQKLTAGFIRSKFVEHKIPTDKIHALGIDETIRLGVFEISFYAVTHSVPDTTGIVMRTPIGILVHQSDFKIDWTPVSGSVPDVQTMARVGAEGVLYMTIDCLGVERAGYTLSEQRIEPEFEEVERNTKGRVLITTTSSNITRLQQAINVAAKSGRKVALVGRSMENNFQTARDLGYLDVPPGMVIAPDAVKRFPPEKLMILIAGSQGQPGSALSRVANFDHRFITASKGDSVVFSADPIPGSEVNQNTLIDKLNQIGCKVYYSALDSDLHVSGHASREEIKLLVELFKPKIIMPIGGSFKNTKAFQEVAVELGYDEKNIILVRNDGDVVELSRGGFRIDQKIEIYNVYVDGLGVGDVGSIVLRDRQVMSEEGIVMVVIPLNKQHNQLVGKCEIVTRGFVFEQESQELIDRALSMVNQIVAEHVGRNAQGWDWKYLRTQIENNLEKYFYQETNRKPLILPTVINL
jgi:ribonuclease J